MHSPTQLLTKRLTSPTYLSAALYWAFQKLTRIQFHQVVSIDTSSVKTKVSIREPFQGYVLNKEEDIKRLAPEIEKQLDEQSGIPCRVLCERGGRIYFIRDGNSVACQLNILTSEITVDSPANLRLVLPAKHAFLNYLFTREAYRGCGLAHQLIQYTCNDLASHGTQRCYAHIRMTNHASRSAFLRSGWKQCGTIITTKSGRFLAALGCASSKIKITPINPV